MAQIFCLKSISMRNIGDCQWWFKRKQSKLTEGKNMKKNPNPVFGVVLIDLLVDFYVFQSDYIKISGIFF